MKSRNFFITIVFIVFFSCGKESNEGNNSNTMSILITTPKIDSVVEDTVAIQCEVVNPNHVAKVELWANGDSTGIIDYEYPFTLHWDTHNHDNGHHILFVRLYDQSGNVYDSEDLSLIVNNFLVYHETFGLENSNEAGYSILQKLDSNFVILGSSDNDILLVEADRYGNINWSQTYGGSQLDQAYHIAQTSDGGFIISGSTESFGFGGSDIRLTKTDPNGLIEWNKYLGSNYNEHGGRVLLSNDGGYLVIGDRDFEGNGNQDIWLIKTNSQGDTLWTKKFGGEASENGVDIINTEDNGFLILGNTTSFSNGQSDIYIIKTDSIGNKQWSQNYGNGSNDYGQSILQNTDGGYTIKFMVESFGVGNTSTGLMKINSVGEIIWSKTYGGTYSVPSEVFYQTNIGNYIFTCSVFNYSDNSYNAWMLKVDENGEIIWDRKYGYPDHDYGFSAIQTLDNGFVLVGSTKNFGNGNTNSSDLWIVKTNPHGYTKNLSQ